MFYNIISLKRLLIALFIRQVLKLLNDYASQIATLKQLHNSIGPTQAGAATPRLSFSSTDWFLNPKCGSNCTYKIILLFVGGSGISKNNPKIVHKKIFCSSTSLDGSSETLSKSFYFPLFLAGPVQGFVVVLQFLYPSAIGTVNAENETSSKKAHGCKYVLST